MSSSLWSILGLRLLEAEIALEQRALPQPGVDDLTPCCLVGCRVPSKQKKGCEKAAKESSPTVVLTLMVFTGDEIGTSDFSASVTSVSEASTADQDTEGVADNTNNVFTLLIRVLRPQQEQLLVNGGECKKRLI